MKEGFVSKPTFQEDLVIALEFCSLVPQIFLRMIFLVAYRTAVLPIYVSFRRMVVSELCIRGCHALSFLDCTCRLRSPLSGGSIVLSPADAHTYLF